MNSENTTPNENETIPTENEPTPAVTEANQTVPEQTPVTAPEEETTAAPENTPSMDDYKEQLESSFRKLKEGDMIKGTVIGISETEVTLDLGYYTEGIIKLEELSNDPRFSIKADVTMGEEIDATIIEEDDGHGHIVLSRKRAEDVLAWERLKDALTNRTVVRVKIAQAVKAGVVTYLYGIRAFIPASQLSIAYVENLEDWVGKEIDAIVITASEQDKKLVLSGKEVEREAAQKDKKNRLSKLQKGIVTKGKVEKIMPYGAFVNIGDGITGLLHISRISNRRIKSPDEVIKEGEEITVKIVDIKDGKISLSMKDVEDKSEAVQDAASAPSSYSTGGEATTGLASLLKNIKLS